MTLGAWGLWAHPPALEACSFFMALGRSHPRLFLSCLTNLVCITATKTNGPFNQELCYIGGPLILVLWPFRIVNCNQYYSGLYPTATTPDPRSMLFTARLHVPYATNNMDQGSVAPTSQSQRYYDKILTILSDPRSIMQC